LNDVIFLLSPVQKLKFFDYYRNRQNQQQSSKMADTDFEIKKSIEEILDEESDNELDTQNQTNIDEEVEVEVKEEKAKKPKAPKKPKLSAKNENYMAFAYWLVTKLQKENEDDDKFDLEFLRDYLEFKGDLVNQTDFYSEFTDNIKIHKKILKEYTHPKKTKKAKKVVVNNIVEEESVVEPIEEPEQESVVEPVEQQEQEEQEEQEEETEQEPVVEEKTVSKSSKERKETKPKEEGEKKKETKPKERKETKPKEEGEKETKPKEKKERKPKDKRLEPENEVVVDHVELARTDKPLKSRAKKQKEEEE
jgi:hypothetical protein